MDSLSSHFDKFSLLPQTIGSSSAFASTQPFKRATNIFSSGTRTPVLLPFAASPSRQVSTRSAVYFSWSVVVLTQLRPFQKHSPGNKNNSSMNRKLAFKKKQHIRGGTVLRLFFHLFVHLPFLSLCAFVCHFYFIFF